MLRDYNTSLTDHKPGRVERALEQRLQDLGYCTGSVIWGSSSTAESSFLICQKGIIQVVSTSCTCWKVT